MGVNKEKYFEIIKTLDQSKVTLIAVSKTKSPEQIQLLYDLGQRDFGENYVQELVSKQEALPKDIRWHFIGHLQTNKVKFIAPFVYMIQGVDSLKLLQEINKLAIKNNRKIKCLLQVHIATEETKFGLDDHELESIMKEEHIDTLSGVEVCGLMGMASFTSNIKQVKEEFKKLKLLFDKYTSLKILSMGMSADYTTAIEVGSTMVRIGSLLFGER